MNESRVSAPAQRHRVAAMLAAALVVLWPAARAGATPFIWDQDQDRLDDRIETVHLLGYEYAFDQGDTLQRARIEVTRDGGGLVFGVFVTYDHTPTPSDLTELSLLGMPVLHRFEAIPAVRSVATFAQAQIVAGLPGVERVEAVEALYPLADAGVAAIAARDPSGQVFPTWSGTGGGDGAGIVIAFIDTGINDAPDGAFPGHESLVGRCLGGASFVGGDSTLDTAPDGSVNPVDRGGSATGSHGTHVAGIALGSGGPSGYVAGVAPAARFVDVKALNDAGWGTGVPEALDWCIHNRARDWGDPDPALRGIDVVNLSLSSVDPSDGRDVASRLAARAAELGMVVVASVGNDGKTGQVPSPAGGPGVLAVGAMDDQRTGPGGDDLLASFSNRGPRADDGDGDPTGEQKPDLVAPGVAVLSADGDLGSDGTHYQRLSGTSMSAAFVSGAAAVLRASFPALDPAGIAALLRATASRALGGLPVTPPGFDPRWSAGEGFGVPDLYAARLELVQPQRTQVARLELTADATTITGTIRTQRERGAGHLVVERAPDLSGAPGAFAPCDSVAAAGDSSLADLTNRQAYVRTWSVPESERGLPFWYRVSYSEGGTRYDSPARRFVGPVGPSIATLEVVIAHNDYDTDVDGTITAGGGGGGPGGIGASGAATGPVFHLPGTSAAVSSDWTNGASVTGNIEWTFRIEVPDGPAAAWLPPGPGAPWLLGLSEGGAANRSGELRRYTLTWHASGGDVVYTGGPVPQHTLEGGTIYATAPSGLLGAGDAIRGGAPRCFPNPVTSGSVVTFVREGSARDELSIFDLAGRRVARLALMPAGDHATARWETRDAHGQPLGAGIYFARTNAGRSWRVAVVRR